MMMPRMQNNNNAIDLCTCVLWILAFHALVQMTTDVSLCATMIRAAPMMLGRVLAFVVENFFTTMISFIGLTAMFIRAVIFTVCIHWLKLVLTGITFDAARASIMRMNKTAAEYCLYFTVSCITAVTVDHVYEQYPRLAVCAMAGLVYALYTAIEHDMNIIRHNTADLRYIGQTVATTRIAVGHMEQHVADIHTNMQRIDRNTIRNAQQLIDVQRSVENNAPRRPHTRSQSMPTP